MYKKTILFKMVLSCIISIVFLTFFELLLRFNHFDYKAVVLNTIRKSNALNHIKDRWKTNFFSNSLLYDDLNFIFMRHGYLYWIFKPNSVFLIDNIKYQINSKSMRCDEVDYKKPRNCFRILFLGDSCSAGWGLNYEDTYEYVLQGLLTNKYPGYKFEIINAGIPGYSSYQCLQYYKKELYKYNPDMLINFIGANDADQNFRSDKEQFVLPEALFRIDRFLTKNTLVYGYLKSVVFKKIMSLPLKQRVSYVDFHNNISELELSAHKNNSIILFISPVWRNGNKFVENRFLYSKPDIDLWEIFENKRKEYQLKANELIYDGVHPSKLGSKIIAEQLFNDFQKLVTTLQINVGV